MNKDEPMIMDCRICNYRSTCNSLPLDEFSCTEVRDIAEKQKRGEQKDGENNAA